ncbi:MAG: erythromycin esterase family protein [Opitutaceae bacterium]|nr:erythromycin esterase family protein [Opitutaceae bacterium]
MPRMFSPRFTRLASTAMLLVASSLTCSADKSSGPNEVIAWVRASAMPLATERAGSGFDDLAPLGDRLGPARIVSLGEPTHGSREVFEMKHRLVEYLATELGFSLFAIEANMPEAQRLNDYVLGGPGDAAELIRGMYFWTWSTEEVRALVEWMRRFNTDPANRPRGRKIEFTGFDMQAPATPAAIARDYAAAHLPGSLPMFESAQRALTEATGPAFSTAVGTFPIELVRGRRIVFSGWMKTDDVRGWAGLWWRADTAEKHSAAFDNMANRGPRGTTPWRRYEVALDIPEDARNVNFGTLLSGRGRAWFDDLAVTIDGVAYDPTGHFDFGFEAEPIRGFAVRDRKDDEITLDDERRQGAKSLRITRLEPRDTHEDLHAQWTACAEAIRTHSVGDVSEQQAWALQMAQLVIQNLDTRLKRRTRDACMADNVRWLAGRDPARKIILWAHNGHISRASGLMGAHLDQAFGVAHVVVGFATARGDYRAMGRNPARLGVFPLTPPEAHAVEGVFAATGLSRFVIDLRPARAVDAPAAAAWFAEPRPFRSIGAGEMARQFRDTAVARDYDLLVYLDETHATVPLPPR